MIALVGLTPFEATAADKNTGINRVPGLVEISAQLEPASPVVPGQRVRLIINVATPRWFTAGTRIRLPEVPGVVLLQNQDFAANATERRGAESWSVQRWSIDVFATRAGTTVIPPVGVSVSVSETPAKEYKNTLQTPALTLTATIPPALEGLDQWVASPNVSLEQTVNSETEVPLGGAIKRTVVIKAENVMAMQLPALAPSMTALQSFAQEYPEPPVLRNRANRGALSAERRDTTTWIAVAPGEIALPSVQLNWWNTDTQTLKILQTDPVTLTLTGQLPERPVDHATLIARTMATAVVLVTLLVLWRLWRLGAFRGLGQGASKTMRYALSLWHLLWDPVLPEQLNPGGTTGRERQPR